MASNKKPGPSRKPKKIRAGKMTRDDHTRRLAEMARIPPNASQLPGRA